jgi:hypothetical protein
MVMAKPNPVEKVVELLEDLKTGIKDDGEAEQKVYDKYACWCEDTTAEKAAAIDKAKAQIDESQSEIVRLGGSTAKLGVNIKQLEKEIAENEEARKEATAIRKKENNEYYEKTSEGEQCLQALENAIGVLEGAGTKKTLFLGTMQQAQILSAAASIRDVVLRKHAVTDLVSDADLALVRQFVEKPDDFEQRKPVLSGAEISSQVGSKNPYGDYAPASTQITGILKSMYDSFVTDREKDNAEEAEKQKAFEEMMKTQLEEYKTLKETLEKKTGDHADDERSKVVNKKLLEDSKAQLEIDEKIFLDTKKVCKEKAQDWAIRTRMRTEELAGIDKAIEILTSDEAKKIFEEAHANEKTEKTFFLQVSTESAVDPLVNSAYKRLKSVATRFHSLRLAALATAVKTNGHFDKVIAMIDKMIVDLRKEEQDDIKKKDMCQNNQHANTMELDDIEYNIDKTKKYIERQEQKKKEVEKAIAAITEEIEATEKQIKELKEDREVEVEDFKKNLKADADAIAILGQAITALSKFYSDNKIPLELVQQPTSKGDSRSQESKGILGILGMIKEDLEKEIKVAREEEAEAQVEYERQRTDLIKTLRAQEKTKNTLEAELAELEAKISEAEKAIEIKEKEKEANEGEADALKEACNWVEEHFDSRREQRKKEIDGLQSAKSILAGAES